MLGYRDLARARVEAIVATARRWIADGASGNYAAAALIGFAAFGLAILGQEGNSASASAARPQETRVAPAPSKAAALARPEAVERTTLVVAGRQEPSPKASDLMLTYDVDYYWPDEPQTVATPTRIRTRPEKGASVLTIAAPGERLRINGRIQVGSTDWYRVRLPDARDGYFAADDVVVALADYRRRRAATVRAQMVDASSVDASAAAPAFGPSAGAPLGASLSAPPPSDDALLPLF